MDKTSWTHNSLNAERMLRSLLERKAGFLPYLRALPDPLVADPLDPEGGGAGAVQRVTSPFTRALHVVPVHHGAGPGAGSNAQLWKGRCPTHHVA